MSSIDTNAYAEANAPRIRIGELLELKSQFCVVEFVTRELLGHGSTWEEAKADAVSKGHGSKKYYKYRVPAKLVPQQVETPQEA